MKKDIKLDLGSVKIHKHVLEEIIAKSISELDGVSLIKPTVTHQLKSVFAGPSTPGIKVGVNDEQELQIHVTVNVSYGTNIPDAARQIQEIVKQDINKSLELTVKDINVDIEGMERG